MSSVRALLLVVVLSSWSVASHADPCAISTGTGGTGYGEDTGSGGTGYGEDTGTGGTGYGEDSGSGGTGVMGTITGFGSVCVNGLRIRYGDEMQVEVDGSAAAVDALEVGQIVRVRARVRKGALHASHIAAESAVAGPIDSYDAATGRLVVMGQAVIVPQDRRTSLGLEPGARVTVSGLRRDDGVIVASRIAERRAAAPDVVTGRIARAASATWVGDVRTVGSVVDQAQGSERVQLHGRWSPSSRTLVVDRQFAAAPAPPEVGRLSIEGFVAREEGELRLHGVPVDSHADAEAIGVGSRVRVEGRFQDGRLRADRVHVDRPRDLMRQDSEQSEGGQRADRSSRSERADRSGRSERSERPERSERAERPERPERGDRSSRD